MESYLLLKKKMEREKDMILEKIQKNAKKKRLLISAET